ncbi:MAG: hypothetical protein JNK40_07765 [Chromatiales bacterium]|nr:hypothetical protein [Chromatiales bacterium]
MSKANRPAFGHDRHGDDIRLRHGLHFNDCEALGRHSRLYLDYLCRDLESHLLAVLRELEARASMVLAGEPRRRVLALLYDRQDNEPEQLASFFIQCTDAESPWQLGFGHVGSGHMGITDAGVWQRHLDEFRENIWTTVVKESRRTLRRSPGY